jgi:alginate O-acetyltransferase complex protein AlgI
MFFDTPIYFLFLPLVVLLYWCLRRQGQNILLLSASYFFYGWWDWRFLSLMAVSTVADFFFAQWISSASEVRRKKLILALSLTMNLAFLGYFKYFNFFAESLHALLSSLGLEVSQHVLDIVLPPGISFYTFQAIAYMVDVYKQRLKPSRHLTEYALFISFFPHLIAGPIQRPDHLLPQVENPRSWDSVRFSNGLMLILTGLFRKCVIADQCALIANAAFSGSLGPHNIGVFLLGAYAFAWQIYGDFSGYSNIARGSAQLLGFHFMVNFKQPYLSTSIRDFWRRWHISLSTWLRDYLYVPLGGNRSGEAKTYRNLFLTMLIGGLWHGANWTFVVWGALHGAWLAVERFMGIDNEGVRSSLPMLWFKRIVVFHMACFAWIFFRAQSITDALSFFSGLGDWHVDPGHLPLFWMLAMFSIPMFVLDLIEHHRDEEFIAEKSSPRVQAVVGVAMLMAVILFSANSSAAFIYFQF